MVAVIDYNAGNIYSVVHALRRLGTEPVVTAEETLLRQADKVIFPGVGEAASTMCFLREKGLDRVIRELNQPLLGICLGMQLMCRHSEEGNVDCLGIFDSPVLRFSPATGSDKVPHMGWNTLENRKGALYKGLGEETFVYFVHSYYVPLSEYAIATTDYILSFSASLQKNNFYATQFHPEKSGATGEIILNNFLKI